MLLIVTVACLACVSFGDGAKGRTDGDVDLITLQTQFDDFKIRQAIDAKITDDKIKHLEDMISSQQQTILKQGDRISSLETKSKAEPSKRLIMDTVESGRVAFSAYLDRDMDGLVTHQKIIFNQATYNEGDFYSVSTGIFTAPMDGVYLFIYFIGNRHAGEVDAELVVEGVKQNEAVAEGVQQAHDTQGGNSAIVKLNENDRVWIDTTLGTHVEGQWRFSSFTGALLYPIS